MIYRLCHSHTWKAYCYFFHSYFIGQGSSKNNRASHLQPSVVNSAFSAISPFTDYNGLSRGQACERGFFFFFFSTPQIVKAYSGESVLSFWLLDIANHLNR